LIESNPNADNPKPPPTATGATSAQPTDADIAWRRMMAIKAFREGWTQIWIAKTLNVSQPTVSRWVRGEKRSRVLRPPPLVLDDPQMARGHSPVGRAPILTDEQIGKVWGKRRGWTAKAFSVALHTAYGTTYAPEYCYALLYRLAGGNQATRFAIQRTPPSGPRAEAWLRQLGAQDAIKESVEELLDAVNVKNRKDSPVLPGLFKKVRGGL
jgi:transposase